MLRRLPTPTVHHLRSGVVVPDVAQIVEELVANSLDASSTSITVSLDLPHLALSVHDNGHGIPSSSFALLGAAHCTSKHAHSHTYGFRGEALSSVAAVSLLTITSRHRSSSSASPWRKQLHGADTLVEPHETDTAQAVGTRVEVRDLFFSFPVRRQQVQAKQQTQLVLARVQRLALMHPEITFTVRDASRALLSTRACDSQLVRFRQLFGEQRAGQAHTIPPCTVSDVTVSGLLCDLAARTRSRELQLVYVNRRPVRLPLVARRVAAVFAKCSQYVEVSDPAARHPFFVLDVRCDEDTFDIGFSPDKHEVHFQPALERAIVECLDQLLRDFIRRTQAHLELFLDELLSTSTSSSEPTPTPSPAPPSDPTSTPQWARTGQSAHLIFPSPLEIGIVDKSKPAVTRSRASFVPAPEPANSLWNLAVPLPDSLPSPAPPTPAPTSSSQFSFAEDVRLPRSGPKRTRSDLPPPPQRKRRLSLKRRRRTLSASADLSAAATQRLATMQQPLTRDMVADMEVLDQVGSKFIIVKSGDLLVAIDQHAADERRRLEILERHVFGPHGTARNVEHVDLDPPQPLSLSQSQQRALHLYSSVVEAWGFRVSHTHGTLQRVPSVCGVPLTPSHLCDFLERLLESHGAATTRPPAVLHILHSKSCRSAIMFGDKLDHAQCCELVRELSKCAFPFNCAHGRPSMAPLCHVSPGIHATQHDANWADRTAALLGARAGTFASTPRRMRKPIDWDRVANLMMHSS